MAVNEMNERVRIDRVLKEQSERGYRGITSEKTTNKIKQKTVLGSEMGITKENTLIHLE